MNTTDKELAAREVALLADIVRELEALSEQGALTAGTVRLPLVKIENIVKGIRRELPQFPNNN